VKHGPEALIATLINVGLPWNTSRPEQPFGRSKRFGRARRNVDMVNPVDVDTQDEPVYRVLSRRDLVKRLSTRWSAGACRPMVKSTSGVPPRQEEERRPSRTGPRG
jgi:hypothetical protein